MELIYFMKNIAQSEQKYVVSYEIYLVFDMFKGFVQTKIRIMCMPIAHVSLMKQSAEVWLVISTKTHIK